MGSKPTNGGWGWGKPTRRPTHKPWSTPKPTWGVWRNPAWDNDVRSSSHSRSTGKSGKSGGRGKGGKSGSEGSGGKSGKSGKSNSGNGGKSNSSTSDSRDEWNPTEWKAPLHRAQGLTVFKELPKNGAVNLMSLKYGLGAAVILFHAFARTFL